MAHYVVIKTTDHRNVGHVYPSLPRPGEHLELDGGYTFDPSTIEDRGNGWVLVHNPNYIMLWKRRG
jgi:hypothetical protein